MDIEEATEATALSAAGPLTLTLRSVEDSSPHLSVPRVPGANLKNALAFVPTNLNDAGKVVDESPASASSTLKLRTLITPGQAQSTSATL